MTKILAIDDIKDNLISLKAILKDVFPEAVVFTAMDGKSGIELAAVHDPDVILLDIVMPEMDGFEVCRRLKNDSVMCEIPVVFLTALKESRENRLMALEAGAEAFLAKPIDITELTVQVRAMLKIRAANILKRDEKNRLEALVKSRTQALEKELQENLRLEADLKESVEKFRSVFESANVAKSMTRLTGEISVNKAFCHMLGYEHDELENKTWKDLTPVDEIPRIESELASLLNGEKDSARFEKRYIHKDGTFIWADVSVAMMRDINRKPKHFITTIVDISEQKLVEASLKQSEHKYRYLFENNPQAMWIYDLETLAFLEVNKAAVMNYGYSKEEFLSMNLNDIRPEDDVDILHIDIEFSSSELNKAGVWKHKKKSGEIIFVEITSHIIQFENHQARLVLANDVTEREKAEKALIQASENWNRTFNAMQSAITLLDIDQKIIQHNKAFQDLVGENEHIIQHGSCFHFVHGSNCPAEGCPFAKMKISYTRECKELTINGFVYEVVVDPIKDTQQEIIGAVHIMTNITQRKRDERVQHILYQIASSSMIKKSLEELLIVVREELNSVLDTTNFFVALYHPETKTLRKVIFEDVQDNFIEWSAGNSLSGQVLKQGKTLLLNNYERNDYAATHQLDLPGSPAACWLGVPLIIENETIGVMVVQSYTNTNAFDETDIRLIEMIAHELSIVIHRTNIISDLIHAKDKAQESDHLKTAFLANMSHEIRTPMNGILGFLELLKEPDLDNVEKSDYIDIVNKSGQRLLATINDIIEISKIEANELVVRIDQINLAEIIQFHYAFFRTQAEEKGLKLVIQDHLKGDQAIIMTDKYKLDSILTNLIKNAIKFTAHGEIEFGNYIDHNQLVFYVKDSGRGIPPDRLDAIFERFVQADLALTRAHEGSGLGLSIVKAYIDALGGKIWINSEVDKGSTFSFSIPYNPITASMIHEKTEPVKDHKRLKDLTVLFAEDDESSYQLMKIVLAHEGIKFIHTTNGKETIEALKQNPATSIILMDLKMPGMDGLEATRQIRQFNKTIPILAQTAHALYGDKEKAQQAGCTDYLSKPLNRNELMRMIEKYTSEPSLAE